MNTQESSSGQRYVRLSTAALAGAALLLLAAGCQGEAYAPPPGPLEATADTACVASPIYLLVHQQPDVTGSQIASFDPQTGKFSVLGTVTVPAPESIVFYGPIAVDHAGQIYTPSNEGCGMQRLFRIDPLTGAVSKTPAAQSRSGDPEPTTSCIYTMAFVADASSPAGETLYVHTLSKLPNPYRLGRIDAATSAFIDIAGLTGTALLHNAPTRNELTGTAKGELYTALDAHFSPAVGTEVDKIDLQTGVAKFQWQLNTIPRVGDADYHSFALWSGAFYFFVQSATARQTDVFRFRLSDFSTTKVATTTDFYVTAVATSQCNSGT